MKQTLMRRILPASILRYMGTCSAISNRRKIVQLAKSTRPIVLQPVPPRGGGGNIEHYYHFVFDLILPLHFLVRRTPPDVVFVLEEFGIYSERLQHLFPNRTQIANRTDIPKHTKQIHLVGMNPQWVHSNTSALEGFKRDICRTLQIDQTGKRNKILLIERLPMDPYFMTRAKRRGGGTSRSSIVNHVELTSTLRSMVRSPFEFHNLQLEKMPLKLQIEYFDTALVVFGQHGAGLANCVWMRRKSTVIELSSYNLRDHFRMISKFKRHHHFLYKTSGSDAVIDISKFISWIVSNAKLRNFFHQR